MPNWSELESLEWGDVPEVCNWKVSVESYSECYHYSINHPTFATGVVKPETHDIQLQGYYLRHTTQYPEHLSLAGRGCWQRGSRARQANLGLLSVAPETLNV